MNNGNAEALHSHMAQKFFLRNKKRCRVGDGWLGKKDDDMNENLSIFSRQKACDTLHTCAFLVEGVYGLILFYIL